MHVASLTASNWTVSTRQDGEVLAVWAGTDDLQLGVFATRDGFSQAELQGWLRDLVGVARESARNDVTLREIPALLHHALTGLLFSHAELWERAGGAYFSMALVSVDGLVGIGWVGEADLQVNVEGIPQEIDWVTIRDHEGRVASAATFDVSLPLRVWVSWDPGIGRESGVAVDAEWRPASAGGHGTSPVELTAEDLAPVVEPAAREPVVYEIDEEPEPYAAAVTEAAAEPEAHDEYGPLAEPESPPEPEAGEPMASPEVAEPGRVREPTAESRASEPEIVREREAPASLDADREEPIIMVDKIEVPKPKGKASVTLSDDFESGPGFTPPSAKPRSSIRQVYDADRYGEGAFDDANQLVPEPGAEDAADAPPAVTRPAPARETFEATAPPPVVPKAPRVRETFDATAPPLPPQYSVPAKEAHEEASAVVPPAEIEQAPTAPAEEAATQSLTDIEPLLRALAEIDPAPRARAATEPTPLTDVEIEPGPDVEIELAPDAEVEPAPGAEMEPAPDAEVEPAPQAHAEIESVSHAHAEIESVSHAHAEIESASHAHAEIESARRPSPEPQPSSIFDVPGGDVEPRPRRSLWDMIASLWRRRKRVVDPEAPEVEAIARQESPEPGTPSDEEEAARAPRTTTAPGAQEPAPPRLPAIARPPKPRAAARPAASKTTAVNPVAAPQLPPTAPSPAPAKPDATDEAERASTLLPKHLASRGLTKSEHVPSDRDERDLKPAKLSEDRLAPIVRTTPERPSLRSEPTEDEALTAPEHVPAAASESAPEQAASTPDAEAAEAREAKPGAAPPVAAPPPQVIAPASQAASSPQASASPQMKASAPTEASLPVTEARVSLEVEAPGSPQAEAGAAEPRPARTEAAPAPPGSSAPLAARRARAAGREVATTRTPRRPAPVAVRVPIRAQWPSEEEMVSPFARAVGGTVGALLVAALFAAGWWIGGAAPDRFGTKPAAGWLQMLEALSLATGRYHVAVSSDPDGASIAVDGRDLARRTPATIDLKPGAHQVTLSYPDLGSASFGVRGLRDQDVTLHEALWGRLSVQQDNPDVPVSVTVDGRDLGFAPVTLDSVSPGAHEVRFSGPSMTPWAQTVAVKVRESARIVAHPMVSPATGVLSVRATLNTEDGSSPLAGGEVWIDGEVVGRTPLTLELPRGPHSIKVAYRQQAAAVQVIDLPGGNQRFASFQFGGGGPVLRLVPVSVASRVMSDQPALVSVGLDGVQVSDVREMWLHVRGADGNWERYPLNVMKTPAGIAGVATFPLGAFDDHGVTKYYLSALLITGDEYYTEMMSAQLVASPGAAGAK